VLVALILLVQERGNVAAIGRVKGCEPLAVREVAGIAITWGGQYRRTTMFEVIEVGADEASVHDMCNGELRLVCLVA
jgi:hypothetical protein